MRNECFLIFASVLFCIPVRLRAAATLDAESSQRNNRMSHTEVMVLPTSLTTRNALLRAFRWLLGRAKYSAETYTTRMPEVIDRAYGVDFSSPVPESNTRTKQ